MRALPTFLFLLLLAPPVGAAEVDYLRDVKPILRAHCFACHGAVRQKAGLRLDAAPLITKGGRHGSPIVAGKPNTSLLLDAVLGRGRPRMPPEEDAEALKAQDIATLRAWIEQGAKMPEEAIPEDPSKHWAFQPPVRPAIPSASGANPIDAFLAVERARAKTSGSPPADRGILLRRLYLDLIGVPPTREELAAFEQSAILNPQSAIEQVVDRLLADPRYGERWGRHWMDVWRYSDPFGSGEEYRYSQRHIWRWRDWIIESLNADVGYDRMVREMLAGDEIAPTDRNTLRATGYLARNWYKFNRNAWMQDSVEYTAAGFLGLTFRCARCHDHKYDPISQVDYYQLRAFFEPHDIRIDPVPGQADVNKDGVARAFDAKPEIPTYLFQRGDERSPDTSRKLSPGVPTFLGGDLAIRPPENTLATYRVTLPGAVAEAERITRAELERAESEVKTATAAVTALRQRRDKLAAGEKPTEPVVEPWFTDSFATKSDAWQIVRGQWAWEAGKLVGKVPGAFSTVSLKKNHPANLMGRLRYKTTGGTIGSVGFSYDVTDNDFQAVYVNAGPTSAVRPFHRVAGADTYPQEGVVPYPVKFSQEVTLDFAVRGNLLNVWADGKLTSVCRLPRARQAGTFTIWTHEATAEFLELRLLELPDTVALAQKAGDTTMSPLAAPVVLTKEDAERAVARAEGLVKVAGDRVTLARAELESIAQRAAAEEAKYAEPRQEGRFQTLARAASKAERQVNLLRARIEQKAVAEAEAAAAKDDPTYTPLVKLPSTTSTGRRLALANWIVDRKNPLTARVAVNHVWMRHFGTPLVASVANFGLAGSKPTHPELLDWLASEFMDSGWSMKRLHRLIVTSEVYRMSSANVGENRMRDPENRTLWRMNPRRMEAEVVRDSLLAIGGTLDHAMGGPILDEKQGQTSRRRSVYFRFNNEYRMPWLDAFDPASPTECYQRRDSVIPQQALTLFNSALAINQSRRLAKSLPADRFIEAAFEAILGRKPGAEERTRCETFLREQVALYAMPGKLTPFPAGFGDVLPPAADPAQRAREDLLSVLFNHNDFVTIR
jgi:hypothetical protein